MVGGVYVQLRDGMASEYIMVPLNTSLKGWNARWFYMKQSHIAIRCDVDHIPELQIYTADHLGTTAAFLLQLEQVSKEVEVRQNP